MKMVKKRIIYTVAVTLIVVFSTTFAILMTLERMDYRNYLLGEYSKNMYELINSVSNIRVNLGKAAIVGSNEQKIMTFEEIFRNASMANDKLHSLPIPQEIIGDTSKFLAQTGDFCYSLVKATSERRELTNEEYNNIDRLKDEAFNLQASLNNVLSDINMGKVKWGEIRKKASGVLAAGDESSITDKFQNIQKQVVSYPSLIYDGPFSDNTPEITPKINSQKEVTVNDAMNNVKKILGEDRVGNIENIPHNPNASIDSYRLNVTIKGRSNKDDKVICEVTKKGGKIIYLIDNKAVGNAKITPDKAVEIGTSFLKNAGYNNMVPTYRLTYDKNIVVNYIYQQSNVLVYPDQIKLKIALDNGDILGIESEKYLASHEDNRNLPDPKVSQEEARKRIGSRLNITGVRLAVIPTETNKEAFCYEFSGDYKGDNYKVYINTQTGFEQRILQIINTPNGQLTM